MNVTIDTPLGRFDIDVNSVTSSTEQRVLCPSCSATRKHKDKPAEYKASTGAFVCFNCGLMGHEYKAEDGSHIKSLDVHLPLRIEKFTDEWKDWLVNVRKISLQTAEKMRLFVDVANMRIQHIPEDYPDRDKYLGHIVPVRCLGAAYVYKERLVSIQYRDLFKNFTTKSSGTSIFYNADVIYQNEIVVITEGWMDAVACVEAGIDNVCSIPNGTTVSEEERKIFERTGQIELKSEPVLKYLENQWHDFKNVKEVVLCLDYDAAGRKLFELMRKKFMTAGKKVSEMKLPEKGFDGAKIKDANDVLIHASGELLMKAYNDRIPVENKELITISSIRKEIDSYMSEGLPSKITSGWVHFDNNFGFFHGDLIGINGYPGNGKTVFIVNLLISLAVRYGHKFLVYSPENYPVKRFALLFAEIYSGKTIMKNSKRSFSNGVGITWDEAMAFIDDHFVFVPSRPVPTWGRIRSLAINSGKDFRGVVIDPVTRTIRNSNQRGMNINDYLAEELTEQMAFGLDTGITTFFGLHPPTQDKKQRRGNDDGSFDHPSQFEVEGGKIWMASLHVLMAVHRPNYSDRDSKLTNVYVQKLKDWKLYGRPTGEKHPVQFEMQTSTSRLFLNGLCPFVEGEAKQNELNFNENLNYDSKIFEQFGELSPSGDSPF